MTERKDSREEEANDERGTRPPDEKPSVIDTVEDAVGSFGKTMSGDRPDQSDVERQRIENDAEQR